MGFSKTFFLFLLLVGYSQCVSKLLQMFAITNYHDGLFYILRVGASHVTYNIEILIEENRICSQHIVFVTQKYSVVRNTINSHRVHLHNTYSAFKQ